MTTRKCLRCDNLVTPPAHLCPACREGKSARKAATNRAWLARKRGGLAPVPDDNSKHRAHADASRKQDEAARMDAIVLRAWEKAQGYDRAIIEANPLNRHLFQGA